MINTCYSVVRLLQYDSRAAARRSIHDMVLADVDKKAGRYIAVSIIVVLYYLYAAYIIIVYMLYYIICSLREVAIFIMIV